MTEKKISRAKERPAPKQKLHDEERHKRFVKMAHEVETNDTQDAFDEAFLGVVMGQKNLKES